MPEPREPAPSADDLRRALRGVAADEPGPHFTAAVLARLGRGTARPRWRLAPLPAWAVAAAALVALTGGWGVLNQRAAAERRRAELRSETAAIAAELSALRDEAARTAPVLYLGGTEEVDVVLDLSTLPLAAGVRGGAGAAGDRLPN